MCFSSFRATQSVLQMVLFAELVCIGCQRNLTYPLGALSCRCQSCHTVNPAMHMAVECPNCDTDIALPVNTLQFVCPCCGVVSDIPMEMLPPVPPMISEAVAAAPTVSLYVEHPPTMVDGRLVEAVSIATKI